MVSSLNRYSPLLIAAMLLVGSNVGIGKSIVAYVPVPRFALLRFVIAMAVLWPLFRVHKLRRVKRGEGSARCSRRLRHRVSRRASRSRA